MLSRAVVVGVALALASAGCAAGDDDRASDPTVAGAEPDASGDDSTATRSDVDDEDTSRGDDDGGDPDGTSAAVAPGPRPEVDGALTCPAPTVEVADADELAAALEGATPGDVIGLAPGTYRGRFVATADGGADEPIWLCGGRDAVIDGGGIKQGYALHLDGAADWRLVGFTVRNAQKGVMTDHAVGNVIQGLLIEDIGDEAIHLRAVSTYNVVRGNEIRDTGQRREKFGEGIYVGSAQSNWCRHTGCEPDRSDRNEIVGNLVYGTTAEGLDAKEGTTGGVARGNVFGGEALAGADSWVDAKGNDWIFEHNTGTASPQDGFQMHEILDGWGTGNVFSGNVAHVDGPGHGFATTNTDGNIVRCDNDVTGAGAGYADVACVEEPPR